MLDPHIRRWFVLYTRARFEKTVDRQLLDEQIESYLPSQTVIKRWSDRKKKIEQPLFPGYVFIHTTEKERLSAVAASGVVRCVMFNNKVAVVRDVEIENIKRLLGKGHTVEVHPSLPVGTRVRIVRGLLAGIEGILTDISGKRKFAVTLEALNRSVLTEISSGDVEELTVLAQTLSIPEAESRNQ